MFVVVVVAVVAFVSFLEGASGSGVSSPSTTVAGMIELYQFLKIFNFLSISFCSNKNLLESSDLNGIIEFLISDYSKKITGQDFVIDDGFTL